MAKTRKSKRGITQETFKTCALLAREARQNELQLKRLRSMAESGGFVSIVVGGNGKPAADGTGEGAAALLDMERRLQARIGEYLQVSQAVSQAIDSLKNTTQREVLRLRYIQGCTWEEVAWQLSYTPRHCHRYHDAGLNALGLR